MIHHNDKRLKNGSDKAFDVLTSTGERALDAAENAAERVEKGIEKISNYGKTGWKSVQRFSEKRPMTTAAIALVAGVVLGKAFSLLSRD